MKKLALIGITALTALSLVACGKATVKPDYTSDTKFEQALNDGKNLTGKTVDITVEKIDPKSAFGFNVEAGEHLNFVSSTNPGIKKGDKIVLKVKKVESMLGSYVITYEKAN